ncbi:MAG TPA: hypothetical protein ENH01_00335 [Nitrospirae bacterium]|nr:hypothetical protein [Nitrospirota bacterium]
MKIEIEGAAESVWCRKDLRKALHTAAKKEGDTRGHIIAKALRNYLAKGGYFNMSRKGEK